MSMSIDLSELRSSTYHRFTSYTNSFFLLRVPLMINEQLSAIGCSEGKLTLNSRYPSLGITFDSLFKDVNAVVKKYGISELTNYWIEDVPLYELKYSTPDGIKKFIRSAKMVQNEIASRISARLAVASGFTASHQYSRLPVVVHTEVFLITPDPAGKDADLKLVTSETLSNCIAMHKKSEVFNFGALFRGFKMEGAPTSHQLLEDLNEIVEWYQLGIQLGIPEAELNNIRHRNDEVKGRRCEMLSTWLAKSPQPTWATIINALTGIGRRNLGNIMALKYGVPVTSSTETKQASKQVPKQVPSAQKKRDPIQQKLSSQVQQLHSGIESKDMELVVSKQAATEAHNSRDIARGRLDEVGKKAVEVQTNVVLLSKKSSDTRSQLEQKRRNLEALKKGALRRKEEFQGVVDHTNEEVRKLHEELAAIQAELASEKEKVRSLPEQLQQAKKELAEKSARVRELESAQQKLETSLEHQRETVDQLLMQESVASDLQQHNMEIKHQLITAKKELEAKAAEVANLKETVAYQDGEVKRLSAELRSREALLQSLLMQLSQATKPDHAQELKSKEELQRLTEEVSELRAKLFRAEDAKQEAQRQMDAAELKSMLLQEIMREYRRTPPPIPPRRVRKPAATSALPGPGKDTWEYIVFTKSSAEVMEKLANVPLAGRIADKLSAAGTIGEYVKRLAHIHAPGVTEVDRVRPIIAALKDKIQQDVQIYHHFRGILLSLGADADTALYYLPEKDPTVHKSTPEKARTPSKDQGHATGQQQITIRGIQWRTGKATPESMEFSYVMREFRLFYVKMPNGRGWREVFNINKPVSELREKLCDLLGVDHPENYSLNVEGSFLTTLKENDTAGESRVSRSTSITQLPDQGAEPIHLQPNVSLRMQGITTSRILSLTSNDEVNEAYPSDLPTDINHEFHKNWVSVVQGNLPCTHEDAIKLAALQYQAYFLDRTAVHSVVGFCRPTEFLPVEYAGIRGIEQKIFKEQEMLHLRSHKEIYEAYNRYCSKLFHYDHIFFPSREPRKKLLRSTKLVLFGVGNRGVMRVDPKTKEVLDTWDFQVLRNWAYSRRTFVLAFMNKNYPVESNQAKWLSELVDFHVDSIISSAEKEGEEPGRGGEESGRREERDSPR